MKKTRLFFFILIILFLIQVLVYNIAVNYFLITGKSTFSGDFSFSVLPRVEVIKNRFDGATTDFLSMNNTELQSIENMTLEKGAYGKIFFNERINLTQDAEDNIVDLDSNVNISYNRIEINTTKLTSLNKSATLYLYNLSFENPRILRDGALCPSSICEIISYSSGNLIFAVTHFTVYSAEETTEEVRSPEGAGGGGEGGAYPKIIAEPRPDFTLSTDLIKVSIKQGETKRKVIKIINTGNTVLDIGLDLGSISEFMVVSEESFSLEPGEIKEINIDIFAREDEFLDVYTGRIIIQSSAGLIRIINVIIEVKEKQLLFDIRTTLFEEELRPGDDVKANIIIINEGDVKPVDVFLYYAIKNFEGDILSFREETLAIEEFKVVVRSLKIPEDTLPGKYIFYSKISYGDIISVSSELFEVITPIEPKLSKKARDYVTFIMVIIMIIFCIMLYFEHKRTKQLGGLIKKITVRDLIEKGLIKREEKGKKKEEIRIKLFR